MSASGWHFWIDRGGTFTDIVARGPDGRVLSRKWLSTRPGLYDDAALFGIAEFLGVAPGSALPLERIASVRLGTTVATNALLERKGAPVVLAITKGFADALTIGTQERDDIFALKPSRPAPLHALTVEIDERVSVDGDVIHPLDSARAEADLRAAYAQGFRALAIVLIHGTRHSTHEKALVKIARAIGFEQISASHVVNAMVKLIPRGWTSVIDAYLSPALKSYVDKIEGALRAPDGKGPQVHFMQSSGALVTRDFFAGKDAVLSGPAGGVVGAVGCACADGFDALIGFDMGGTSTDVCHYDGHFERDLDNRVAGVRLRAPMMAVHTVAAGGGSILTYDNGALAVGPHSAGADPGPLAYRRGGPLTVTDANIFLGRLALDHFPKIFGPKADQGLDHDAVARAFGALATRVAGQPDAAEVAEGFVKVAVENMAQAIRHISIERGHDLARHALVSFGGAGGQHACAVADALGITRIYIHPLASLLSAFGMGLASLGAMREASLGVRLDGAGLDHAASALDALAATVEAALIAQGVEPHDITLTRHLHIRYAGSDATLMVAMGDLDQVLADFAKAHQRRFGFAPSAEPLVIETVQVEGRGPAGTVATVPSSTDPQTEIGITRIYLDGAWRDAKVLARDGLDPAVSYPGPALIVEPHSTLLVEIGWSARRLASGAVVLSRVGAKAGPAAREDTRYDPVALALFGKRFMAIAEHMGATLEKTAFSVNIKERLDFSCALFDGQGDLIANAPHMPVHLGSMGESVKTIIEVHGAKLRPGDIYALNAPYRGGTHLPDVTVIQPVFLNGEARPAWYVAARGHHADIGGITPGSMPPGSTRIEEEGVVIDALLIARDGQFLESVVRDVLAEGPHPARNPDQNLADLKAQIAACAQGAQALQALAAQEGRARVDAYMAHVQDQAESAVRRAVRRLKDGHFTLALDDGGRIQVAVTIDPDKGGALIDFTGTSPQSSGNMNAPRPVTLAAVLYVFRCLIDEDLPLNAGCLRPLSLVIPVGSLLAPRYPAAVAAGNVETSQAVTDALFGALGVMAAAQGTMNNLTFGDGRLQYYETICGGTGAGSGFEGTDAIQAHMTNSRLTDPEILEARYPVRVESFAIRHGSGGAGQWRGGDGVIRRLTFLSPMRAGILSSRRKVAPFGLEGGGSGAKGETWHIPAQGPARALAACEEIEVAAGDSLEVLTPGGGGFGKPAAS